jgi:hypothetical protein
MFCVGFKGDFPVFSVYHDYVQSKLQGATDATPPPQSATPPLRTLGTCEASELAGFISASKQTSQRWKHRAISQPNERNFQDTLLAARDGKHFTATPNEGL